MPHRLAESADRRENTLLAKERGPGSRTGRHLVQARARAARDRRRTIVELLTVSPRVLGVLQGRARIGGLGTIRGADGLRPREGPRQRCWRLGAQAWWSRTLRSADGRLGGRAEPSPLRLRHRSAGRKTGLSPGTAPDHHPDALATVDAQHLYSAGDDGWLRCTTSGIADRIHDEDVETQVLSPSRAAVDTKDAAGDLVP